MLIKMACYETVRFRTVVIRRRTVGWKSLGHWVIGSLGH